MKLLKHFVPLLAFALLAVLSARGATNVVTTANDTGTGSLRQTIVNSISGDTITFTNILSGQTILLTSGQISINKDLIIDASNIPSGMVIDGKNNSRVFDIPSGTVVLNSLIISNANGGAIFGGAVRAFGNLTLNNCKLVNNRCSGTGGALSAVFGSLTMNNTTISGNVCGNCSGVYIQDEVAKFIGCTISGNGGSAGDAIRINGANTHCPLTAINCTIAGNTATNTFGAAISITSVAGFSAKASFTNCTIVSNIVTAASQPGAIFLQPTGGTNTLALFNTIVAHNTSGGVETDISSGNADAASANNFVGAGGGLVNGVNGNMVGTSDPQLSPLASYGGPTQTMPPLATSPVIDAGGDAFISGVTNDQSGALRLAGPHVDIGAVELPVSAVVLNNADSGYGSLRYAANYTSNNATLTFFDGLSGQTIGLTSGEIFVNKNVTINASALPAGITIKGDRTNRVFDVGGGVTLALTALTITNGGSSAVFGGAIQNYGTLIMSQCTLVGNSSAQGGAIENGGNCYLTNCTLANNFCSGNGGGIDNNVGSAWLTHCTVVGNTGGGIINYLRTLTLLDTIVAGSTGPDVYNFGQSTVIRTGPNIVVAFGNDPNGTNIGPAAINSSPLLSPLGNYGGPTPTMPPLPGSPAINAAGATALTTDQRGLKRPSGSAADIGAVEVRNLVQNVIYDAGGFELPRFTLGNLTGQDGANGPWLQAGTGAATVQNTNVAAGAQAVRINRTGADTRFAVSKTILNVGATQTPIIAVEWQMKYQAANLPFGSYGPLFGIEVYDGAGNSPLLAASASVDATTAELLYQAPGTGFLNAIPGISVPPNTWHSYRLELNYSSLTYRLFYDGTEVLTNGFVDSGIADFTDAPIAALAGAGDPTSLNANGTAFFDNYKITAMSITPQLLSIRKASAGQVTVSWTPPTPGSILLETPSLSPANWTLSPSVFTNPVTVPAVANKFYRLYRP